MPDELIVPSMAPRPPRPTRFPYTTLFRSPETLPRSPGHWVEWVNYAKGNGPVPGSNFQYSGWTTEDRKSTRLNSSHLVISYAVFCLKKKKKILIDKFIYKKIRTTH